MIEQLTYAQIAERLGISPEAARAIVKRHRLSRSRSNDGKTLVAIDLEEIRHKPLPARSPRGHQSVTDTLDALKARIAQLEAELASSEQRSAGHRADFEKERERCDRLVTELVTLAAAMKAKEADHQPVTTRTWREMTWRERIRWLRTTG
jgi:predicted  nucleic acid-binding Zn-ribbon protein